jgi:peptide/nickel transport system permease protein
MISIRTWLPKGLARYTAGRLIRALASLLIFQAVLFGLIQALPASHAGLSEGELLEQVLGEGPSDSGSVPSQPTQAPRPAAAGSGSDPFAQLRESGSPEMVALLDEAAVMEENFALEQAASQPAAAAPEPEAGGPPPVDAAPAEPLEAEPAGSQPGPAGPEPASYEEALAAIRPRDQSVVQRFASWLFAFFRGDLGESLDPAGGKVIDILLSLLPTTLLLLLPGTVLGLLFGLWLGKRVAWRRRSWVDWVATLGGTAFYSAFPPWLAFVVVAAFAVNLQWFPVDRLRNPIEWVGVEVDFNQMLVDILLTAGAGVLVGLVLWRLTRRMRLYRNWARGLGLALIALGLGLPWVLSGLGSLTLDVLDHLVLPMVTLILLSFGETMLIMRTTMAEAMDEGYVSLVRAMGYSDARVRDRHVAPVAILPVLTRFIVHLPFVIAGSFFIERGFHLEGVGNRLVEAANQSDFPVVLGILSLVGVVILTAHVVLDLVTAWLDPRLRITAQAGAA